MQKSLHFLFSFNRMLLFKKLFQCLLLAFFLLIFTALFLVNSFAIKKQRLLGVGSELHKFAVQHNRLPVSIEEYVKWGNEKFHGKRTKIIIEKEFVFKWLVDTKITYIRPTLPRLIETKINYIKDLERPANENLFGPFELEERINIIQNTRQYMLTNNSTIKN